MLKWTPKYVLVELLVVDEKTGNPLGNSAIELKYGDQKEDLVTDENGIISYRAEKNMDYFAEVSKSGYLNNTDQFKTSNSGSIKREIPLKEIVKGITFKVDNIFYDLNKATLRPESEEELDKLAKFLSNNQGIKIELSSHTDSRGSDAYNMRLSQQRAQSCVDYLIKKGINKSSIIAKGYGETKLVNRCKNGVNCSEEEHQENRRTEIKILDIK